MAQYIVYHPFDSMLRISADIGNESTLSKVQISPTKTNYLASLFFADIVNVYHQTVNSM
jgi:hypothetical protein